MITLKEYLASLMTSVSEARKTADIESATIAQLYAQHKLLRNLPVPRFRVEDIELNIPIAIDELEEKTIPSYQPIDNVHFSAKVYQILKQTKGVDAFENTFSRQVRKYIRAEADKLEMALKSGAKIAEALPDWCMRMAQTFIKNYNAYHKKNSEGGKQAKQETEKEEQELVSALLKGLEKEINPPLSIGKVSETKVIVEASKLREIRNENIVHIKIRMHEEGMEWHKIEKEDGETDTYLLPE